MRGGMKMIVAPCHPERSEGATHFPIQPKSNAQALRGLKTGQDDNCIDLTGNISRRAKVFR
jgi:hypothetical protein